MEQHIVNEAGEESHKSRCNRSRRRDRITHVVCHVKVKTAMVISWMHIGTDLRLLHVVYLDKVSPNLWSHLMVCRIRLLIVFL